MKKMISKRITASILCVLMLALSIPCCVSAAETTSALYEYTQSFDNAADFTNMPTWNATNTDLWYASGFESTQAYGVDATGGKEGGAFKITYDPSYENTGTLFYKIENAIEGILEISADIKMVTESTTANAKYAGGMMQQLNSSGSSKKALLANGKTLYAGVVNDLEKRVNDNFIDGKWHNVKWILNTTTGECSLTYTDTLIDSVAKDSVTVDYTIDNLKDVRIVGFQPAYSIAVDTYIDNFSVKQLAFPIPDFVSSSVTDDAENVAANGSITLNFSSTIEQTVADTIKLYKGEEASGTPVNTMVSVSGTSCLVSYANLDGGTVYTLFIPANLTSDNTDKLIKFKTKNTYVSYVESFDNYSDEKPFVVEPGNMDHIYKDKAYWYTVGALSEADSIDIAADGTNSVLKMTNNLKKSDNTDDTTALPKLYYRLPEKISGVVEVSYRLKIENSRNYLDWGNNFFAALCENGGSEGAAIGKHSGGLYIPSYNENSTPAFNNEHLDGNWHDFKIVLDYNTMKYTVTRDNVTSAEYDLKYGDVRTLEFRLGDSTQISMYIDDLSVVQTQLPAPTLTSSSISDGAKGVPTVNSSVALTFSDSINADSAEGIKLYKGTENGTLVETSVEVSENVCTLSYPVLENSSLYTIVIPNTVKSVSGVNFAGQNISFTTKAAGLDVNIDFEGINVTGETEAQRIGELNEVISKKYGVTSAYAVNWKQLRYNNADEETTSAYNGVHSSWNGVFDGSKNLTIEDGKLKLYTSKDCEAPIYYMLYIDPDGNEDYKITDGKVNISFTVEYETKPAGGNIFQLNNDSSSVNPDFMIYLAHGSSTSTYYFGKNGTGSKQLTSWHDTAGSKKVFDIEIDFTGETAVATATIDGNTSLAKTMELPNKEFDRIYFYANRNTANDVTYTLDDIRIKHTAQPTVTASVANGAENVSTVDNIDLTFNAIMNDVSGITLKDSGNNDASFRVVPDYTGYKYSLRLTEPLKTNTEYTLTIPELTSADGLTTAAQTITFTTEAASPDLYISDYTISGAESIEASETISVSADFNNKGADTLEAWLGIALYSADGKLQKIGYADASVAAGIPEKLEASFKVPAEIGSGAYIKIFAWNGSDLLKPIRTVITD